MSWLRELDRGVRDALSNSKRAFMGNGINSAHLGADAPTSLRSGRQPVTRYPFAWARRFVLPTMAGAFGLYVAMHSPLRDAIAAALKSQARACYFGCLESLPLSSAVDTAAALVLIAAAVFAAWVASERWDGAAYERPLVFGLSALAFIVVPAAALGGVAAWSGTALLR